MAGLTPEEQAFFESGGDTSKLNIPTPAPGVQGEQTAAAPQPAPSSLEMAGLSNADTPPTATPAPQAPVATPAPVAPDPNEFLRAAIANSNAQIQALSKQIADMQSAATKPPEVQAPDPNTDPLGSMFHRLDQVNKTVADLQKQLLEQQNQQKQIEAFNNFQRQVTALKDEFAKTHTDFDAAYTHLRDARTADLRAFGMSEDDIRKTLFQEEFNLSQTCVGQSKNPAEAIYEMAKRHGYQPKPAAPAPAAVPKNIGMLKQGVDSAPPTLPKTHVPEDISIESLRDASDADLNKLVTDPAAWAKIAGTDRHPI